MLLIILGIALVVLGFVYDKTAGFYHYIEKNIALKSALIVVSGIIAVFVGVFAPVNGFNEPVIIQESELEEIIENSDIYVIEKQRENDEFLYVTSLDYSNEDNGYNSSNI